jgi:hypothetical protein
MKVFVLAILCAMVDAQGTWERVEPRAIRRLACTVRMRAMGAIKAKRRVIGVHAIDVDRLPG